MLSVKRGRDAEWRWVVADYLKLILLSSVLMVMVHSDDDNNDNVVS